MNILFSYAFMNKNIVRFIERAGGDCARILIDSGAFSVKKQGMHIVVGDYMHLCKRLDPYSLGYIMLDVAGDQEATKKNLELFLDKGLEPMPVWTVDGNVDDLEWLKERMPRKQMCVAGGVDSERNWIAARYGVAREVLGDDVFIHGLGFTAQDTGAVAVDSVDSSTHQEGVRHGILAYYEPALGRFLRIKGGQFRVKKFADLPGWAQDLIVRGELQQTLATSLQSGDFSWVHLITTSSWIEYALDLKRQGVRLFYACTEVRQLVPLALVAMHRKSRVRLDWEAIHRDRPEVLWMSKKDMAGFVEYFKEATCKVGLWW